MFKKPVFLFLIILLLIPVRTLLVDLRAPSKTVLIKLYHTSPSYAAFEDSRIFFYDIFSVPVESVQAEEFIQAGDPIKLSLFTNMQEPETLFMDHAWPRLKGLTISQINPKHTDLETKIVLNTHSARQIVSQPMPAMYHSSGRLLPVEERRDRLAEYYSTEDIKAPTVEETIKKVVARELAATASGVTRHFVQKPKVNYTSVQKAKYRPVSHSVVTPPSSVTPLPYWIQGNLQMFDGLAYTGKGELTISQVINGVSRATGRVSWREGHYEIYVAELAGYLIAELWSPRGELLGFGEYDLYKLPPRPNNENRIHGIHVDVYPAPLGILSEVISAYSFGNYIKKVRQARLFVHSMQREIALTEENLFRDEGLMNSSSYILNAAAPDHWGSLALGVAGQADKIKLFPDKMIKALISITQEQLSSPVNYRRFDTNAVIWGKVMVDGKPVAGASIELAGEELVKPIYFNQFIPDKTLKKTSKNGMFAFVNVPPGLQAVRAWYDGRYLPVEIIPTEPRHVTAVKIISGPARSLQVSVFDSLDIQNLLLAELRGVNEGIYHIIQGQDVIEIEEGKGVLFLEVDAGTDYELIRVTHPHTEQSLTIPMLRRNWLQQIATERRINLNAHHGIIVGFVQGKDYEVFMDESIEFSTDNVVYFNEKGNVLHKQQGFSGGGFVLFNVPRTARDKNKPTSARIDRSAMVPKHIFRCGYLSK